MEDVRKQHLDMLMRTAATVTGAVRRGIVLDKELVLQSVKKKDAHSHVKKLNGMGPSSNQVVAFNAVLSDTLKSHSMRYGSNEYKNGLDVLADLLISASLKLLQMTTYPPTKQELQHDASYSGREFQYGDEVTFRDRDEVNAEAEAWDHHKEYIDNHD